MAVTRADGAAFDAKMAGADLREKVFYLAKIAADGDIELAGSGELVYGIITEGADVGYPVTVQTRELGKAICGAAITAGSRVMADSDGKAVTQSGGTSLGFGIARSTTANANEIVEIEIDRIRGA